MKTMMTKEPNEDWIKCLRDQNGTQQQAFKNVLTKVCEQLVRNEERMTQVQHEMASVQEQLIQKDETIQDLKDQLSTQASVFQDKVHGLGREINELKHDLVKQCEPYLIRTDLEEFFENHCLESEHRLDVVEDMLKRLMMEKQDEKYPSSSKLTLDTKVKRQQHIASLKKSSYVPSELIPFNIPQALKTKLEQQVQELNTAKSPLKKMTQVIKNARAYTRVQLQASAIVEDGYISVETLSQRIVASEKAVQILFEFIRILNQQLDEQSHRWDDATVQHAPEQDLASTHKRLPDAPSSSSVVVPPTTADLITGMTIAPCASDPRSDHLSSESRSGFYLSKTDITNLRRTMNDLSTAIHKVQTIKGLTLDHHFRKLGQVVQHAYGLLHDDQVHRNVPSIGSDLVEIVQVICAVMIHHTSTRETSLPPKTDLLPALESLSSNMKEIVEGQVMTEFHTNFIDLQKQVHELQASTTRSAKGQDNTHRLDLGTTSDPTKSSRGSTPPPLTMNNNSNVSMIGSIKGQLIQELGLNRLSSERQELVRQLHEMEEKFSRTTRDWVESKHLKQLEQKLNAKVDKVYVKRMIDLALRDAVKHNPSQRGGKMMPDMDIRCNTAPLNGPGARASQTTRTSLGRSQVKDRRRGDRDHRPQTQEGKRRPSDHNMMTTNNNNAWASITGLLPQVQTFSPTTTTTIIRGSGRDDVDDIIMSAANEKNADVDSWQMSVKKL